MKGVYRLLWSLVDGVTLTLTPGGRENRSPSRVGMDRLGLAYAFVASDKSATMVRQGHDLPMSVHCYSLSPGERVRVRASVRPFFSEH
jgi:hypothetical protein